MARRRRARALANEQSAGQFGGLRPWRRPQATGGPLQVPLQNDKMESHFVRWTLVTLLSAVQVAMASGQLNRASP